MSSPEPTEVVHSSILPYAVSTLTCPELPQLSGDERRVSHRLTDMPDAAFLHQIAHVEGAHPSKLNQPHLKVAAWNLEQGRNWEKALMLIDQDPFLRQTDVWLLSEVDYRLKRSGYVDVALQMARAMGFHVLFGVEFLESTWLMEQRFGAIDYTRSYGYHGNAILSRYPLESPFLIRFPSQEKWWVKQGRIGGRMALGATIKHVNGKSIAILTTHLESGIEPVDFKARRREVGILMRYLAQHHSQDGVILGGDFNARPTWPEMRNLDQAGFRLALTNDLYTPTMQRIQHGQLNQMPYHIDYLLTQNLPPSPDCSPKVIPAQYPPRSGLAGYISDHHVVVAELSVS